MISLGAFTIELTYTAGQVEYLSAALAKAREQAEQFAKEADEKQARTNDEDEGRDPIFNPNTDSDHDGRRFHNVRPTQKASTYG